MDAVRHGSQGRKLSGHIFNHNHKSERANGKWGKAVPPQSPSHGHTVSSKATLLKSSTASSHGATNWRPSA